MNTALHRRHRTRRAAAAEALERRTLFAFSFNVESVGLVESDDGTNAVFRITTQDAPATEARRLTYATRDGTPPGNVAVAGEDYDAKSGQVTFGFGVTAFSVVVPVRGDTTPEGDETFHLDVTYDNGTAPITQRATATVYDDDSRNSIVTVSNAMEMETRLTGGQESLRFTLTLHRELQPGDEPVEVRYTNASGTGSVFSDVPGMAGGWTFVPGAPTTHDILVPINYDTRDEGDETIYFNVWGDYRDNEYTDLFDQGVGVIRESTSFPHWPVTISDYVMTEGHAGTKNAVFTLSMPGLSPYAVFAQYELLDGTARAGSDYEPRVVDVAIPPMTYATTIEVPVIGDTTAEFDEVFGVKLVAVGNGSIGRDIGTARIENDDEYPTVSISNARVAEGDAGETPMQFEVRLSEPSGVELQAQARLRQGVGSATPGTDFVVPPATRLTFAPGEMVKTFTVMVKGDVTREGPETFQAELFSVFQGTLGDAAAFGTIVDDDTSAVVVGHHVFYNNSVYDGYDPAANHADLRAVPLDKEALLPVRAGTFANVTSYTRGINGVIIDVYPAVVRPLTEADFDFRVGTTGDPSGWAAAPAPSSITLLASPVPEDPMRAMLTWPDGAITNTWLRVTMKANERTRLAEPDVFSFGNLVGDTGQGNPAGALAVGTVDLLLIRRNLFTPAPLLSAFDFNRDGRLSSLDLATVRRAFGNRLPLPEGGPVLATTATSTGTLMRVAEDVLAE